MTATPDVRALFDEYVFRFIDTDIRREVWLADETERRGLAGIPPLPIPGGGNVLAALGMMAYTEFLGSFISGRKGRGWSMVNFAWGFRKLGQPYRDLRDRHGLRIYDTLRNGLVHEYSTKENCDIVMRFGARQEPTAVGRRPNGRFYFVIEAYREDLMRVAKRIYVSPKATVPQDGPKPTLQEQRRAFRSGENDGLV